MAPARPGVDEMASLGFFGRWRLAFQAMRALAVDVVDPWGQQAFQWALDAWGIGRVAARARKTEAGRRLLATRPRLTIDLAVLERLPEGSLGRFLATWYRAWGITPFAARRVPRTDIEYFVDRLFFAHDVWHAVSGLGTDHHNELRFLSVLLAQYASGSGLMALLVGWLQMPWKTGVRGFVSMPREALAFYRWSRRSQDLCFVPWEALFEQPLERLRAQLFDPERPRLGEWQTWPSARVVLPAGVQQPAPALPGPVGAATES
jgi:ubiquinone biosynthesis protein Coq4